MRSCKTMTIILSALLVVTLLPTNALAQMLADARALEAPEETSAKVPAQTVENQARVLYCVFSCTSSEPSKSDEANAEDKGDAGEGTWVWFDSLEQAESQAAVEAELEAAVPVVDEEPNPDVIIHEDTASNSRTAMRLRLLDAQGAVELRTRFANDDSWTSEWQAVTEDTTRVALGVDVQVRLAGEVASAHDVWYRAHTSGTGWSAWVSNGASVAEGNAEELDNIQVVLLAKGQPTNEQATIQDESEPTDNVTSEETDAINDVTACDEAADDSSDELAITVQDDADKTANTEDSIAVVSPEAAVAALTVRYKVHAQSYGWMAWARNGAIAGTEGEGKRLEAIRIALPKGADGGIAYRVKAQSNGWMGWKKNGAVAGTEGEGKRLEAIRIKLTGSMGQTYDVWYRAHVQSYGWSDWVKNGSLAGTASEDKRLEAIQVVVVPKGGSTPQETGEITGKNPKVAASVNYRTYSSVFGWNGWLGDGSTSGVMGVGNMVEGFCAELSGLDDSNLHYRAYMQGTGWQGEVTGGAQAGLPTQGKRVEAIRMRLSGKAQKNFDIYYRVYVQGFGWTGWAKNNAAAGSFNLARCVEAMQVRLVAKGDAAPSNARRSASLIKKPTLQYAGHVESYGWMAWTKSGHTCGTTGEGKRLEAIKAKAIRSGMTGQVQINAHVQSYGWRGYVAQGKVAGAVGEGKRLEAIRVRLTGELKQNFDVWYRVRVQGIGWMGWAKNGQKSGTESLSLRVEAAQIKILDKSNAAPGATNQAFIDGKKVTKLGYQNPAGYYQVSTKNVSITKAARAPWNYVTPSRIGLWATRKDCVNVFIQRAREYVGSPYVWNYSCAPGVGVDCIGLVYQCAYACGMDLGGGTDYDDFNPWAHYITGNSGWHSHDANNFWNYGKALHVPLSSRRAGDVIWWPGHVAIYLGNDQIIEAYTPATGVIYSGLYDHGSPSGCIRLFQ